MGQEEFSSSRPVWLTIQAGSVRHGITGPGSETTGLGPPARGTGRDHSILDATVEALLSDDPSRQPELYANLRPAEGRFMALDEERQEEFRGTLDSFVRAYAFLAQVMPWTDPDLERLFLFGKLLLLELPGREGEPLPQLSTEVQLTHLRLAVTSEESIALAGSDEPGSALPGEGVGSQQEPLFDKLSALVQVMNEKFGADLDDADMVWVDQVRVSATIDDYLVSVARNNDRLQYRTVLEEHMGDVVLDRGEKNQRMVNAFFENTQFRMALLDYMMESYDEIRAGN